jgi:hypothetical protein
VLCEEPENSNNKESNIDDVSTIEHQKSGEPNPFNKSSFSKLRLKLGVGEDICWMLKTQHLTRQSMQNRLFNPFK